MCSHREEEFFARRFFKPFEISLDHLLVAFQNKERRIDEMNVHADFVSIFSGQWPVLKLLPLHLAVMLVHLLPYLEQITASLAKTSECMSILTGVPVRLKRGDKCVTEAPPGLVPRLGRCLLGDTMVAGNRFADGTYRLLLEIGPLSARKMETFFPGAANNRILNALMELFLPSDKEIQVRYIIQQEDARFRLGTPDGYYYNFSGCGNTLNCNHPVVRELILDCLRYWVTDYRVDGFRFDLASILGRNEDGSPMSQPPLLQSLAFDPILGNVKLIAEAWDAGGLYQVGSFPSWRRWAEWNGRYRDDMRRFLKGDDGLHETALKRILGSPDLYNPQYRGGNASVNFLTCHDGFTLCDLYSYNQKHNEANGWNNTDGCDDNHSWNCGEEGETSNPEILRLRLKMMQNACALLMCSRGTPMFLSGDEFADTRFGNNNPYCQDNEISWLDWSLLSKNQALFAFFQYMIAFRKQHPAIRRDLEPSYTSYPSMSGHGLTPEPPVPSSDSHTACVMFAGFDEKTGQEDLVFLAVNAHWIAKQLVLPSLPNGYVWKIAVNTGDLLHQTFSGNDMPTAG